MGTSGNRPCRPGPGSGRLELLEGKKLPAIEVLEQRAAG